MSKLELLTGKNYLSFSALNSYLDCGERFRLERIVRVPQENSWWLVGGTAFHSATELLDKGDFDDPVAAWDHVWSEELAKIDDVGKLRAGGRATKEWPDRENGPWWTVKGPEMVSKYLDWRKDMFKQGWQWFITPTGEAAVEIPVDLVLGDVQVKGYIDRVMVNPDGELVVVDLKTGNHTPASTLQLGVYKLGIERSFGISPMLGAYYMARKAELSPTRSLLHYTSDLMGDWFAKGKRGIEEELFIPHVTSMCNTCSVAPYCVAVGGMETK